MNLHVSVLIPAWQKSISDFLGESVTIEHIGIVSGGSISDAHRVITSHGPFFAKLNNAEAYPNMFEAEAIGLKFLIDRSAFDLPKPIDVGEEGDTQWILTSFIESASKANEYWEEFGKRLAHLHQNTAPLHGFDSDNYFGSLVQPNKQHNSWTEFFVKERLDPQLKIAVDHGRINPEISKRCQKLYAKLDDLIPQETPAALHGDLWTGNFMTGNDGHATIFDPAVYFGHREVDIAMSQLFGSFDQAFYNSYNEVKPLEPGWEKRIEIFNLYPLLAHVNLFGESYVSQVNHILRYWS